MEPFEIFRLLNKQQDMICILENNPKAMKNHEGGSMLEITEKASEMIKDFLKDREEIPAIRIMMSQGG